MNLIKLLTAALTSMMCALLLISGSAGAAEDIPPFFGTDDDDSLPAVSAPDPSLQQPALPGAVPQPGTGTRTPLEGTWQSRSGNFYLILTFTGSQITINHNGQVMQGIWQLQNGKLDIRIDGQKPLSWTVRQSGNQLLLQPGNLILKRLTAASQAPWPQQQPAPQIPAADASSLLNGTWTGTARGLNVAFVFRNGSYVLFVNGRQLETGNYVYNPGKGTLTCTAVSGQNAGQRVTQAISVNGNRMMLIQGDLSIILTKKRTR